MNRSREPAFRSAELLLSPEARVAIVGPPSRTWYQDQGTLIELYEWLDYFCIAPTWLAARRFAAAPGGRTYRQEASRVRRLRPIELTFLESADSASHSWRATPPSWFAVLCRGPETARTTILAFRNGDRPRVAVHAT